MEITRASGPGRPRVSSREAIERAAVSLFLSDGYEKVTLDRIAVASGVSRATFFRYFDSKAALVFGPFDLVLHDMRAFFGAAPAGTPAPEVIAGCVLSSTRDALANPSWLDRFVLLETSPGLSAEAAAHWESWSQVIADYLAGRYPGVDSVRLAAYAGAVRAAYVALFRRPGNNQQDPSAILADLAATLPGICRDLAPLLGT